MSLLEMIKSYASQIASLLVQLHDYECQFEAAEKDGYPNQAVGSEFIKFLKVHLGLFAISGRLMDLHNSLRHSTELQHDLTEDTRIVDARHYIHAFRGTVEREISEREFFFVRPKLAIYYNEPLRGWGDAPAKFPKSKPDIVEASWCLALERPTAAVFHLMRVAEIGLRVLAWDRRVVLRGRAGRVLKVPLDLVAWDKILNGLEEAETAIEDYRKTAAREAQLAFYHGAMMEVRAFKNLYRNRVMHTRESYRMHQAENAMSHVRDFMTGLTTHLSEEVRTPVRWTNAQLVAIG